MKLASNIEWARMLPTAVGPVSSPVGQGEASIVKGMLDRGDRKTDIMAWFGITPAVLTEIEEGRHQPKAIANREDLPPKGPYPTARSSFKALKSIRQVRKTLKGAMDDCNLETYKALKQAIKDVDVALEFLEFTYVQV